MAAKHVIFVFLFVAGIWTFVEASTKVNCPTQIKQQPMEYCHMFLSRFEGAAVTKQDSLLQRCCKQLGMLDQRCRCMEIQEFIRVQQGGGWDAPRMKRLLQEAPNLPKKCSLAPGSCRL